MPCRSRADEAISASVTRKEEAAQEARHRHAGYVLVTVRAPSSHGTVQGG